MSEQKSQTNNTSIKPRIRVVAAMRECSGADPQSAAAENGVGQKKNADTQRGVVFLGAIAAVLLWGADQGQAQIDAEGAAALEAAAARHARMAAAGQPVKATFFMPAASPAGPAAPAAVQNNGDATALRESPAAAGRPVRAASPKPAAVRAGVAGPAAFQNAGDAAALRARLPAAGRPMQVASLGRAAGSVGSSAPPAVRATATVPTNLRAATTQRTSISIAWSFNGASQGFRVQRSSDGGATWTQIVQTPGSATAVQDSGLTPGTKYLYRVQALNDDGPTAWSSALSKTTLQ